MIKNIILILAVTLGLLLTWAGVELSLYSYYSNQQSICGL